MSVNYVPNIILFVSIGSSCVVKFAVYISGSHRNETEMVEWINNSKQDIYFYIIRLIYYCDVF